MQTKLLLLLAFFFLSFFTLAQEIPQNSNQTDENGLRQGTWTLLYDAQFQAVESEESTVFYRIITYQDDKPVGKVNDYFRSGKMQWEGTLLTDRPQEVMEGTCTWYYESGITQQIAIFENGQMVSVQQFNPDGTEFVQPQSDINTEFPIGMQHYQNQDYKKAIEIFEKYQDEFLTIYQNNLEQKVVFLQILVDCYKQNNQSEKVASIEVILMPMEIEYAQDWRWLYQRGRQLYTSYKDTYVLDYFEKAYQIGRQGFQDYPDEYCYLLMDLATLYQDRLNHQEAISVLLEAKEIWEQNLDINEDNYYTILYSTSIVYLNWGRFEESENYLLQKESLIKNNFGTKSLEYAFVLNELGFLYYKEDANKEAEKVLDQAKTIFEEKQITSVGYAQTLRLLGETYKNTSRLLEAELFLIQSSEIYAKETGQNTQEYAINKYSLGNIYTELARYQEAEELYKDAITIYQTQLKMEDANYASVLVGLANVLITQRRNAEAELLLLEAQKIYNNSVGTSSSSYVYFLGTLATLYTHQGLFEKSEELYLQSLEVYQNTIGKDNSFYIRILNNLSGFYAIVGRQKDAKALTLEAIEICKNTGYTNTPDYALLLDKLATQYLFEKDYPQAESLTLEAKQKLEEIVGDKDSRYALICSNLAMTYIFQYRYQVYSKKEVLPDTEELLTKAEKLLLEAKEIYEKYYSKYQTGYITIIRNIASIHQHFEDYEKAGEYYSETIDLMQANLDRNFDNFSEQEKREHINSYSDYFITFNEFVIIANLPENRETIDLGKLHAKWLNLRLTFKGILLNNTQNTKQRILQSGDEELIQKYQNWITRKNQLAQLSNLSIEEREARRVDLEALEEEINTLEKEVNRLSEPYALKFEKKTINWKDIQRKLNPNEIAIEMVQVEVEREGEEEYLARNTYAALIFTNQSTVPEMILLENGDELEGRYLTFYNNTINRQRQGTDKIDEVSYNQYWKPIADKITEMGDFDKVYFSPDGVYHQINLNSLYNPETEEYLIKEQNIHIVSNLKDLIPQKGKNKAEGIVLFGRPSYGMEEEVFSDYTKRKTRGARDEFAQTISQVDWADLEGTEKEITSIDELLQSQGFSPEVYLKESATEDQIKQIYRPRLLHIATHGFFIPHEDDADNPFQALLQSGLVLAGVNNYFQLEEKPNTEDGILTSYEAMNLDLTDTELVVLSACQTGTGEVQTGEGVFGLQRALTVAGARNLVMSLWKVDDNATQELMTNFYQIWLGEGKDKREAFREAQIRLMESYPNPYHWGAFVMVGE